MNRLKRKYQLSFAIDLALKDELQKVADKHDRPVTREVRQALRSWIEMHKEDENEPRKK